MNIDRVVEAIRTINRLHPLGDAVYSVRAACEVLRTEGVLP